MFSGMEGGSKDLSVVVIIASQDISALLRNDLRNSFLVEAELELGVNILLDIEDVEVAVEHTSQTLVGVRASIDTEFVENAFVFVQIAELGLDRVIKRNNSKRLASIGDIPDLYSAEVSGEDILAVLGEGSIADRDDDVGEEVLGASSFLVFQGHSSGFRVAGFSKISDFDDTLAGRVEEEIVTGGVELGRSDNFGDFLEVIRLKVDDIEGLSSLI